MKTALTLIITVLAVIACGTYAQTPNEHYSNAKVSFVEGKFDNSIAEYTAALDEDSTLGDIYYNRGVSYMAVKDMKSAIQDFSKSITRSSIDNAINAFERRGLCYQAIHFYDEAYNDYSIAISLQDPSYRSGYFYRAMLMLELNKIDSAYADLTIYLASYREELPVYADKRFAYAIAFLSLGSILSDKGDYTGAISSITKSIALNESEPSAYLCRGIAYLKNNMPGYAYSDFSSLLQLSPTDDSANYYRGISELLMYQYEAGFSDLKKAAFLGNSLAMDAVQQLKIN
jgi:tetratricopeptide (TPR) repeat protein